MHCFADYGEARRKKIFRKRIESETFHVQMHERNTVDKRHWNVALCSAHVAWVLATTTSTSILIYLFSRLPPYRVTLLPKMVFLVAPTNWLLNIKVLNCRWKYTYIYIYKTLPSYCVCIVVNTYCQAKCINCYFAFVNP